jgi:DNA-binding response OmpR family regulator
MNHYCLPPSQLARPRRILVADDDEPLRRMLGQCLEDEGYQVHLAANGKLALEAMSSFLPDLIVLDVTMPELDGIEVARRVRDVGDTPILMISGLAHELDRRAGLSAGATDYMIKPMRLRDLLTRVEQLLPATEANDEASTGT